MRLFYIAKTLGKERFVSPESPADRLRHQYALLHWGTQALTQQSTIVRASIEQAATSIVQALLTPTYQFTLNLPDEIITDSSQVVRLNKPVTLHAGSLLHRMQRKICHEELLKKLVVLGEEREPTIAHIARLVNYRAAELILSERIPESSAITALRAFDHKKQRLCSSDEEAEAIVERLTGYVDQLHIVEALYSGWMASEMYTDKRATLLQQITEQGRALAYMQTAQLIDDLKVAWQRDSIGGGLTLFIPFMDEHHYHMSKFEVEVMPNARIPFRPSFVVSACRLAEREVRQNSHYAQATRWQLLAHLDLITQAFDVKPDAETSA